MNRLLNMSDFEQRITSIVNMVRATHGTHIELMERYRVQVDSELGSVTLSGRRRYSNYMRGYVFGYYHAQSQLLYNSMEFCYLVDGVLYTTAKQSARCKVSELYGTPASAKLRDCPSGSYWPDKDILYF